MFVCKLEEKDVPELAVAPEKVSEPETRQIGGGDLKEVPKFAWTDLILRPGDFFIWFYINYYVVVNIL